MQFTHNVLFFVDLYPSSYEEWQPVKSIVGVINTIHAFIGEQQYHGRLHSELARSGIFFYDHFYNINRSLTQGELEYLPLPSFISTEWPLPSSNISEAFRCKLFNEVQKGLKPNNPSRFVKIKVSMPIDVFVDFFASCPIAPKNTMLVCKNMETDIILEFLDKGWDKKSSNNIICEVDSKTVSVKYMIKTQNFILSYYYTRSHFVHGNKVALDRNQGDININPIMHIDILVNNQVQTVISLGRECTLQQLRQDLINEDEVDLPDKFAFKINTQKVKYAINCFH